MSSLLRVLISFLSLLVVVTKVVRSDDDESSAPHHPNILYLITDQQRFDAICRVQQELLIYRDRLKVKTPNLDRLSRQGAYFRNAYTQCPVCGPARTTLRTGCTIERTGVQHNDLANQDQDELLANPHDKQSQIIAEKINSVDGLDQVLVRDHGYTSEYYGKWHIPKRFLYLNESRAIRYNHYSYDNDTFLLTEQHYQAKLIEYLTTFENLGLIDRHDYEEGDQKDSYTKYPYQPFSLDSRYGYPTKTPLNRDQFPYFRDTSQNSVIGRYRLSREYTPTYFNADVGIMALERLLANTEEYPFLLTLSFHSPHPPMVAPYEYLQHYYDNRHELLVPPSIEDGLDNSGYREPERQEWLWQKGYNNSESVQEWTAAYYALVEEIDQHIGEIMDVMENHPENRNTTLIVFTSDHGEMLGSHGLRSKGRFLEEAVRVPLFIIFPETIRTNTIVDEPVSHLDLFATILDYAGAGDSDTSDGTSLRRFIEGTSWNEHYDETVVVSEWDYRKPDGEGGLDRSITHFPNLMIRKGPYKLVMFKLAKSKKIDMLYDLSNDPYEVDNLIGRKGMKASDAVIGKAEHLKALLVEWMERHDGGAKGYYSDPIYNARGRRAGGDIDEIRQRRQWRLMDFWVSDRVLHFGRPVSDGSVFRRNEFLYVGRTVTEEPLTITADVTVHGPHASLFAIEPTTLTIVNSTDPVRVKVSYQAMQPSEATAADLRIRLSTGEEFFVQLSCTTSCIFPPPTEPPTGAPSASPTELPTESPIGSPSSAPSEQPTRFPSTEPSELPTALHSILSNESPTRSPSPAPTDSPSRVPSRTPNEVPSQDSVESPPPSSPPPPPSVPPTPSEPETVDRSTNSQEYSSGNRVRLFNVVALSVVLFVIISIM